MLRSKWVIRSRRLLLASVVAWWCVPAFAESENAAASAAAQPKLEIENLSIDLGRISDDDSAEAVFVLHNRGQAELRILKAKPS